MNKLVVIAIVVIIVVIIIIYVASMNKAAAASSASAAPAALPAGIVNGGVYRCDTDGAIYKVQNGQKQHYASPTTYAAAGSPAYTSVSCSVLASIPSGADI